jgi:hypothetical protein
MLVRLSRAKRLRAGRLVALVYLLCVLAPTLSFALPGSRAVSPCLAGAEHVPGMTQIHAASHVDTGEPMRDHAMAHSHVGTPDHAASVQARIVPVQPRVKGSHLFDGKCCGLMCLSALPATPVEVVTPSVPRASTELDRCREVTESGPSERYRPPIA